MIRSSLFIVSKEYLPESIGTVRNSQWQCSGMLPGMLQGPYAGPILPIARVEREIFLMF